MTAKEQQSGLLPDVPTGPVECLGMTFPTEDARREHFLGLLREKLKDPEFRKIEGFPKGSDEDILRLSDPPWYTACPNPFLSDFVEHYGKPYDPKVPYSREPLAVDVSEGKTDPLYTAHSYHTKVPHKAIMRAILHYTEPGDVVLDGFCGSGMTGVAALACGAPDAETKITIEAERNAMGLPAPKWGARRAVLNDLGPAASFIAANYTIPFDVAAFEQEARRILKELENEIGWMYETAHPKGGKGRINYTVWSEVFACPECSGEVVFLKEALDAKTKKVRDVFKCPHCSAELCKDNLQRIMVNLVDPATHKPWKRIRLEPVIINYGFLGQTYEKEPDQTDLALIGKIEELSLPPKVPTNEIPYMHMTHERARMSNFGVTHIHHFYLPRLVQFLGTAMAKCSAVRDRSLERACLSWFCSHLTNLSIRNRYRPEVSFPYNPLGGVYYIPSLISEASPFIAYTNKLKRMKRAFSGQPRISGGTISSTASASNLVMGDSCIDYIFTDPPFGENIYYADLNFLAESWFRIWTESHPEAIIDRAKKKDVGAYQRLVERCFMEYARTLKPGRWLSVCFHNSHNAVWNALQEALQVAGFVVADVRTMDRQSGSYKQVTSSAMKQDLVVSAYKPNGGLEQRFKIEKGTEKGVWDFVQTHLRQLPVFVAKAGKAETIAARQPQSLYDRMVAFHVERGVTVPLSAAELYAGLRARYPERDGMFFLSEQAVEYDRKRMSVQSVEEYSLFVCDESTAIQWLSRELKEKPQKLQELTPKFLKELTVWSKFEKPLELRELLDQNFFCYDGQGEVPSQVHAYLSTNFHELRGKPKDAPELVAKARDRWFVPDPNKAADVEKIREKALLKEFWTYLPPGYRPAPPRTPDVRQTLLPFEEPAESAVPKGKKVKVLRVEAVRTGFKYCWQNSDYRTIIAVAERIPEKVLQEDAKLLMWYDQAQTRMGEHE